MVTRPAAPPAALAGEAAELSGGSALDLAPAPEPVVEVAATDLSPQAARRKRDNPMRLEPSRERSEGEVDMSADVASDGPSMDRR